MDTTFVLISLIRYKCLKILGFLSITPDPALTLTMLFRSLGLYAVAISFDLKISQILKLI